MPVQAPIQNLSPLSHITIVLARPEGQANIGMVCRAMKTMGLTKLKIVNMQAVEDLKTIRTWSLDAFDIYDKAQHHTCLSDAIITSHIAVATSRRLGKNRKFFYVTPKELANSIYENQHQDIAIVFGNEKNGLDEKEMDLCHTLLTIPTSTLYPSLNLAQAVQIVCYELYQHKKNQSFTIPSITCQHSRQLAQDITEQLDKIGFFAISRDNGKRHLFNFWNAFISRASLSTKEADFLERMIRQFVYMKIKKSK